MSHSLSRDELIRYNRQIMLPELGVAGQEKLKNARVLVVGAGGLGSPVLLYLAGAGIGKLGVIDFDTVEVHNLHRQILFNLSDNGKNKAIAAAENLKAKNPIVNIIPHSEMLNESNAEAIISEYDIVVDGCDNFLTRYLVNDTCVKLNKPLIYGSILKDQGQLALFNVKGSKNLRDLYPEAPNPEDVPSCDQNGVMGYVPGIIGMYMCNLTIQLILGETQNVNKLFLFDLTTLSQQVIEF